MAPKKKAGRPGKKLARSTKNARSGKYERQRARTEARKARRREGNA